MSNTSLVYENNDTLVLKKMKRKISKYADDLKFIEPAVEAGAAFIISGDRHLLKIKKHGNTAIVNPVEFLEKIQK